MLKITISINNKVIYSIEAVNISNLSPISDYQVQENVNGLSFKLKGHVRSRGALVLAQQLIKGVQDVLGRR